MKKLLITFTLLYFMSPTFADIIAPDWSEFCPKKYLNVEYKEYKKPNPLFVLTAFTAQVCTLNTIPFYWHIINKENQVKTNNYWISRKIQFNNEISNCNQITDNNQKVMCYSETRKLEFHKNDINNGAYSPKINVYNQNTNYTNYVPLRY